VTIVHLGSVFLQVEREATRYAFREKLKEQLQGTVVEVVGRCIEEALEAEVTSLLGRGWYERRRAEDRQQTAAQCTKCGSQYARDFRRDGHYRRYLDTSWGRVRIRVPQVECMCEGRVNHPRRTRQRELITTAYLAQCFLAPDTRWSARSDQSLRARLQNQHSIHQPTACHPNACAAGEETRHTAPVQ
jgi:hypothetical protein